MFEDRIEHLFNLNDLNSQEEQVNDKVQEFKNSYEIKEKNLALIKNNFKIKTNLESKIAENLSFENVEMQQKDDDQLTKLIKGTNKNDKTNETTESNKMADSRLNKAK